MGATGLCSAKIAALVDLFLLCCEGYLVGDCMFWMLWRGGGYEECRMSMTVFSESCLRILRNSIGSELWTGMRNQKKRFQKL